MKHIYDPECLGCATPDELPGWLAEERAHADELEQRAKTIRAEAGQASDAALKAVVNDAHWRDIGATQAEEQRLHGEANALFGFARNIRAHADRVEAAHPQAMRRAS